MKGNMKAAVFKDVERIDMEVMPIPSCPPDGILIRICACGICGSDVRNSTTMGDRRYPKSNHGA